MAVATADLGGAGEAASGIPVVTVHRSVAEALPTWQVMRRSAVLQSAYQDPAFLSAWAAHEGEAEGWRPSIVVIGAAERPLALLPLAVRREAGLLRGAFMGGRHVNAQLGLWTREALDQPSAAIRTAIAAAGRAIGADVLVLRHQPRVWGGVANPLANTPFPLQPSPSSAWKVTLDPDPEALFRRLMSGESYKKLRAKDRKLAAMGSVTHLRPQSPEQARAVLAAFFAFKTARFAAQGIVDPFASPTTQAFLAQAAAEPAGRAPLRLDALALDGRILAVAGGLSDGARYSGTLLGFDPDPALARISPGDQLLRLLIADLCRSGHRTFDLGVGEAAYKRTYCPDEEPLVDVTLPVSPLGHAAGALIRAATAAKRRVKQSQSAMALVARLRRLRAKVSPPTESRPAASAPDRSTVA